MKTEQIVSKLCWFMTFAFTFLAGLYGADLVDAAGPAQVIPDNSLYQLEVKLEDQDGVKSALSVYQGKEVIISLFYGSCNYSCPVLFDTVKKILADVPQNRKKDLRVLLVSIDPEKDTALALKKLAMNHALDLNNWKLVRTSEDEVAELAAVLDVKYRKIKGGDYNHTPYLGLLDKEGVLQVSADNFAEGREKILSRFK